MKIVVESSYFRPTTIARKGPLFLNIDLTATHYVFDGTTPNLSYTFINNIKTILYKKIKRTI